MSNGALEAFDVQGAIVPPACCQELLGSGLGPESVYIVAVRVYIVARVASLVFVMATLQSLQEELQRLTSFFASLAAQLASKDA